MLSYAFIVLHVSIILAGFTGVLGRLITLNEGLLVWYRVMLASVFFLLYLVIKNGRIRLPFKDILRIAWVGLLLCIHWLLFYGSIKYSNVSIGVVCFASVGFFTAIIDPFWSKRAFSIREVSFSLLTIFGTTFNSVGALVFAAILSVLRSFSTLTLATRWALSWVSCQRLPQHFLRLKIGVWVQTIR